MYLMMFIRFDIDNSIIAKFRFKRLRRTVILYQEMSRGYLIRQQALHVSRSVKLVKVTILQYLYRKRLWKHRNLNARIIQRFVRGYITRTVNPFTSNAVYILKMLRKQRIAIKVTCKLQSLARMKLVLKRINKLKFAVVKIQCWIRARFDRIKYLYMKCVTIWIQTHWRRLRAMKASSKFKMATWLILEYNSIEKYKKKELEFFSTISTSHRRSESQIIELNEKLCEIRQLEGLDDRQEEDLLHKRKNESGRQSTALNTSIRSHNKTLNSDATSVNASTISSKKVKDSKLRLSLSSVNKENLMVASVKELTLQLIKWNEIGQNLYKYGKIKATRRLLGFNSYFDLSDVYPISWMKTICKFESKLREEKLAILFIAVGHEHTVIVDNNSNFYSFGSGN